MPSGYIQTAQNSPISSKMPKIIIKSLIFTLKICRSNVFRLFYFYFFDSEIAKIRGGGKWCKKGLTAVRGALDRTCLFFLLGIFLSYIFNIMKFFIRFFYSFSISTCHANYHFFFQHKFKMNTKKYWYKKGLTALRGALDRTCLFFILGILLSYIFNILKFFYSFLFFFFFYQYISRQLPLFFLFCSTRKGTETKLV